MKYQTVDLAYNPRELRGAHGQWVASPESALKKAIHGDVQDLEAMVKADMGPKRIDMPQLSGVPLPGSKAAALPHAPGQEVDLTDQFEKELRAAGVAVQDTAVPVSDLKPTQDQLVMSKVAGLAKYMLTAPKDSPVFEPIFVSADNHVIDGHHRWAARTVVDRINGTHTDMAVRKIGLSIADALPVATEFMGEWGLPRAGMTGQNTTVSTFAKTTSLSKVALKEVDLVRHVRTPAGEEWYHKPIGSPITAADEVAAKAEREAKVALKSAVAPKSSWPANPSTVPLNGRPVPLDKAVEMVADSYDWGSRDEQGASPADLPSVLQQDRAQVVARSWFSQVDGTNPEREQLAASLWEQYQNPELYGTINRVLRTGKPDPEYPQVNPRSVEATAAQLFKRGGYTTTEPMTVYRALKSDGSRDWSKELTPGTVFTDKGMVSSTAHSVFAAGWLQGDDHGAPERRPMKTDVVVELHVPPGTRIVGGDPQFIETMLPPGTSFKVISSEVVTAPAHIPTSSKGKSKPETFTRVVAEVQP